MNAFARFGISICLFLAATNWSITCAIGCKFFPVGEYLRFVRIPENFLVGQRILTLTIKDRQNLGLESIDKGDDAKYFDLSDVDEETVDIILKQSLESVVNNDKNVLKFRLSCSPDGLESAPNFLSVSVFVEDVNNHSPQFVNTPYHVMVDELTPVGLNIFRGIRAVDLDKANTPNSDIKYSIIDGNEKGKFTLENGHNPGLLVHKALDYDTGDHEFQLVIQAADRGSPPLSDNTTVFITVKDNDDLPVSFKRSIYFTKLKEFYPITSESIRKELRFDESIKAFDQDASINTKVTYDIVSGNELGFFEMDPRTGKIFLISQLDRENLRHDILELTIRARQVDSDVKFGHAKVVIEVEDLNDNLPEFEHLSYNISIMENLPSGFSVLQVYASDADKGENAEFVYKLEDLEEAFQIDEKTGWLTVHDEAKLDREEVDSIHLKVLAVEKLPSVVHRNQKKPVSIATVSIGLLDANDNSPVFKPSNLFHFEVTLDTEIGSVVGQVTAQDADAESNGNGKISYEFQNSNTSHDLPFEIDAKTGYIFILERPLPKPHYTLLIEAFDQPSNPSERRHSLAVVQIDVVKADVRHSPEFVGSPYEFWVGTTVGVGTSVGQVKVKDLEIQHTVYDLLHSYYEGVPFAIEERTGIIAVVDELNKFSRHHYDFEAYVTDSRHTLTTNVSIHVVDPVQVVRGSSVEPVQLSIKENLGGVVLANLRKLLLGPTTNTRGMEFLLANYELRDRFAISRDGTIYTLKELDREERQDYILTVIAQNRGVIQGQGIYQVVVRVIDENDNKPKFDRKIYEGRVPENSSPGTPLAMTHPVIVSDKDEGINAKFRVTIRGDGWDRFRVDPSTGKIYVGNIPLDREERSQYIFELVATDSGNLSSTASLRINIEDVNDNAPVFNQKILLDPPELDVSLGRRELLRSSPIQPVPVEISSMEAIRIPETLEVGSKIARVLAIDKDSSENSAVFYRLVSENSNRVGEKVSYLTEREYQLANRKERHFRIDRTSGEITLAKTLKPNMEHALNISASDRGGLRSHTGVKVIVFDVNNFQPIFQQSAYSLEILEGSTGVIGSISAQDGDSGLNGALFYSLKSKIKGEKIPFSIDSNTGEISITGQVDREARAKYFLQAEATDSGTPPMQGVVDVQIEILDKNDNKPTFFGYTGREEGPNGEIVPVYETSVLDNVSPGTPVMTVFANDSDSIANGNGLVLLHLRNHHREFYIDSKNGTIITASKLNYDKNKEYNLTILASDLGKVSQTSTARVRVKILDSMHQSPTSKFVSRTPADMIFDQRVYTFQVPDSFPIPFLLTVLNVTEKYKGSPTNFEILGDSSTLMKFRLDSNSGAILIISPLENNLYEFVVRGHNPGFQAEFDTRQKVKSFLDIGSNEAQIRVIRTQSTTRASIETTTTPSTHEPSPEAAEPAIVTKGTPPPGYVQERTRIQNRNRVPIINVTNLDFESHEDYQRNANFFAGEVAVLTLSSVIFLGGLIAAIAVACVRKRKRRQSHRSRHHMPILPPDIRLQKQLSPSVRIANGPTRPILFPMALPTEPMGMMTIEDSSDQTSDTYTDSAEGVGHGCHNSQKPNPVVNKATGFSVCPNCRKLKKPGRKRGRTDEVPWREVGPMKRVRGFGMASRDSLQSSHDSGIDGSDGCHCFKNLQISETHFEDSLMMPEEGGTNKNPSNLEHQKHGEHIRRNNLNLSYGNMKGKSHRRDGVVIL